MRYRPEIDGLRAIAVLVVIFYHAELFGLSGGFVGVDVFFVISGYLITALLAREISEGRYSIANFYERRARRILPPLFVVAALSVPPALYLLPPLELRDFSESLSAVGLMGSNLLFWLESGYFDTQAELKPPLHTWSLAVEEQYYLIFPLLLQLSWGLQPAQARAGWVKRQLKALRWMALLSLMPFSLALAEWSAHAHPVAGFFLIPTRGWELLMGAAWALYEHEHKPNAQGALKPWQRELLSLTGLGLIALSCWSFDAQTPFPSLYTLLPTTGALLVIIASPQEGLSGRLLSSRASRQLGLISYSAYLWHQPLLAYTRRITHEELSVGVRLGLIGATLVLAQLSWRWVERVARDSQRLSARWLWRGTWLGTALLVLGGLGWRAAIEVPSELEVAGHKIKLPQTSRGLVHKGRRCSGLMLKGEPPCAIERPKGSQGEPLYRDVVIIGDSHARVLSSAIRDHHTLYQRLHDLSASACPFVLELSVFRGRAQVCSHKDQAARLAYLQRLSEHPAYVEGEARMLVMLVAFWPRYLNRQPFDNERGGRSIYPDMWVAHELSEPRAQAAQAYLKGVQETLKALLKLKGVEPLLMFSPHVNGWDPVERSRRVAQNAQGVEELIGALRVPLAPVEAWVATFERPMMAWLKEAQSSPDHARLTLFESRPLLCPAARGWCEALSRDEAGRAQLWFSDSNHLSQAGAERLARALTDELLERRDRDK